MKKIISLFLLLSFALSASIVEGSDSSDTMITGVFVLTSGQKKDHIYKIDSNYAFVFLQVINEGGDAAFSISGDINEKNVKMKRDSGVNFWYAKPPRGETDIRIQCLENTMAYSLRFGIAQIIKN